MIINRRKMWRLINKRLVNKVNADHAHGILNILFEELANDLKQDKEIEIYNFGIFVPKRSKQKIIYNNFTKRAVLSKWSKRRVKFIMNYKLRPFLRKYLDFEKTFKGKI